MADQESLLYKSAIVWKKLCNERIRITYGYKCTLHHVEIAFQPEQFFHLAGFQYAKDATRIPRFNSRRTLTEVLKTSHKK